MGDIQRRMLGYGLTAVAVGGLVWVGFVRKTEPDLMTMLGAVDVQLRMASGMPAKDQQGRPVAARRDLIDQASAWLERIERAEPGRTTTCEYRAYVAYLEGQYAEAATLYGQASAKEDCPPTLRGKLVLKQSRMLIAAGRAGEAVQVLDAHASRSGDGGGVGHTMARAKALHALGKHGDAMRLIEGLAETAGDAPQVLVDIGGLAESVGEQDAAAEWYGRAAAKDPFANYFLARLKVRQGDLDSSLELLKRAAQVDAQRVRMLIREDRSSWEGAQGSDRFEQFIRLAEEAAQPGR